jgi:hypothetical protein
MNYKEWLKDVPAEITGDALWTVELDLDVPSTDLDLEKLLTDVPTS